MKGKWATGVKRKVKVNVLWKRGESAEDEASDEPLGGRTRECVGSSSATTPTERRSSKGPSTAFLHLYDGVRVTRQLEVPREIILSWDRKV